MKGKIAVTGWKDWMNVKVLQKVILVDETGSILLLRRKDLIVVVYSLL